MLFKSNQCKKCFFNCNLNKRICFAQHVIRGIAPCESVSLQTTVPESRWVCLAELLFQTYSISFSKHIKYIRPKHPHTHPSPCLCLCHVLHRAQASQHPTAKLLRVCGVTHLLLTPTTLPNTHTHHPLYHIQLSKESPRCSPWRRTRLLVYLEPSMFLHHSYQSPQTAD